jgi:hypothetical protein
LSELRGAFLAADCFAGDVLRLHDALVIRAFHQCGGRIGDRHGEEIALHTLFRDGDRSDA